MGKSILTANQQRTLDLLGKEPLIAEHFYLTGGTALAEFYLKHRYSEDLDFFSEGEVDTQAIFSTLKKMKKPAGIKEIDFEQSFNRNLFFLRFDGDVVKTEFTFFPFTRIEAGTSMGKLRIDSILDIAVNKVFTIYQKPRARDFIDLYLILKEKEWVFEDLMAKAKIKFDWHIDPLQLGAQLLQVTEVKDYPKMLIDLDNTTWQEFFLKKAKKLKGEILE